MAPMAITAEVLASCHFHAAWVSAALMTYSMI
jgi:hypothetical protein